MQEKKTGTGGSFIICNTSPEDVFIPEDFGTDQQMIALTCREFLEKEVFPMLNEIDGHVNPELMPQLLDKAGDLGLLGTSVPVEYGGYGMDFNTSMLVAEEIGAGHSFAVALSAHSGIGTLPIVYYGNDLQKSRYLPKLASGKWKAAYCLTEPDSGSDANSGKTRAVLSQDGKHWLITGQKMWITNAAFADLFIVFARIENDKNLTAFIVEKNFGGITIGPEEEKMGIRGSSTCQIFFNDCPVPAENMLSTRDHGFKIAVNILNIGRIKLAAAAIGAAKRVARLSKNYAAERKQFGKSIGEFGAIKFKLAEQFCRIFAAESATFRAGKDIENLEKQMLSDGTEAVLAKLKATESYSIECALLKVYASEMLDFVTDEGVQIYGGMGYSAEAPMERAYRDSRINRIFEGTNEINRLLAVGTLLKKAIRNEIDFSGPAQRVQQELMEIPDFSHGTQGFPEEEKEKLTRLKKAFLLVAGAAVQKLMLQLEEEQEIMIWLADMLMEIFIVESALLRTLKLKGIKGPENFRKEEIASILLLHQACEKIGFAGRQAVQSFALGDELKMLMLGLKRFTRQETLNTTALRRELAHLM